MSLRGTRSTPLLNEAFYAQAVSFNRVVSDGGQGAHVDSATGNVCFRFRFPNARHVAVLTEAPKVEHELRRCAGGAEEADGVWEGTVQLEPGFQYVFLKVDGSDILSPYLQIGFGYSRPANYVDVPPPRPADCAFYMLRQVPHGSVVNEYFFARTTGRVETCLVYLPPSYLKPESVDRQYPVLFLQAGHGSNETDWVYQGKVNFIADNLIAAGTMREMLILMANGMVQVGPTADVVPAAYAPLLVSDLLPFIEAKFRVRRDRDHRAIAGLSMGSMQASYIGVMHQDLFAYMGVFSGFFRIVIDLNEAEITRILEESSSSDGDGDGEAKGEEADVVVVEELHGPAARRGAGAVEPPSDPAASPPTPRVRDDGFPAKKLSKLSRKAPNAHIRLLRHDAERRFHHGIKLFYRCIGEQDEYLSLFYEDDALIRELGIPETRVIYRGHHTWSVWREAARDFLPLLFQPPSGGSPPAAGSGR